MIFLSSTDKNFLETLEHWLNERPEILLLIRYSRAAGSKSFEFFSSLKKLHLRLLELPPSTNVIAFRQPQLPLRGVVDDAFIEKCIHSIPEGTEFVVVETGPRTPGKASRFFDVAGESHQELREALGDLRGNPVAAGVYPPWDDDSPDVLCGLVPDDHGNLTPGIY